jgi:beta-galactosidase
MLLFILVLAAGTCDAAVTFNREFSPLEGMVSAPEKPYRQELCLNGTWQFQPAAIPAGWAPDQGTPPTLRLSDSNQWDQVPIKIPSPWNINAIGHDPKGGGMDSRTFPSYPESWSQARMGWLRKTVVIPDEWKEKRVVLHLEAVAGDCRVLVNGKEMGSHFDVTLPGEFDITSGVVWGRENEILLGIRDHRFFAEKGVYGKLTHPTGSMWLMEAVGVWQDVYLLAKPGVNVPDMFLQPRLDEDLLVAEVEVVNATAATQVLSIELPVYEWINQTDTAKTNVLKAPEISWVLGEVALRLSSASFELAPGEKKTVTLKGTVKGRLKKWEVWTRGKPNLYAAVAEVRTVGVVIDKKYQRFGWRQVKLEKGDFLLNGVKTQLMHDGWHFTGVPCMTRRYAWGWYTLAKDAHVNLVRPHAMPYPRYFYDMADEMGMLIMDESGIFGSHCNFNYDSEQFWDRNRAHVERLVRRDRNHPSVIGWSVANEVRCVLVSRAPLAYQEKIYDKIFDLCKIARALDPTRQWVQSDGDKDLNGRLDVWLIHCGGEHTDTIPPNKLWGVTEGGSSYYGKPGHYEKFVGDRAYRSFKDRMDALAKEDYNLVRTLRKQDADIVNVWNLVWHALKPLPLGLKEVSKRQMELTDGVFFGPYAEGKPGIQPERISPFSTTVNPGYDPSLPLIDPHPLYPAMQAAMHPDGPQPCDWDCFDAPKPLPPAPVIANPVEQATFAGKQTSALYDNLKSMGVRFSESSEPGTFMIVDLASVDASEMDMLKAKAKVVIAHQGTVLLLGISPASQEIANQLLPHPVVCTEDVASSLLPNLEDERTACLSYKELYFAENFSNPTISRSSLSGDFVKIGRALLVRNNTDWLRWLSGPEHSKTISVFRSELENSRTPVLVECRQGRGRYLVSTLVWENLSDAHVDLYRKLLTNLGLKLEMKSQLMVPAFTGQALVKALALGRFGAASIAETLDTPFIDEASVRPTENSKTAGQSWVMESNGGDRFVLNQLKQSGPKEIFAVYFSYWVYCPLDLSDLLNSGPDLPKVSQHCYVSDTCKLYLNGHLLKPTASTPADYRTRLTYQDLPLKQGWNHFLIKVASDSYHSADPGTLAVRLFSANKAFEGQLKTAVQLSQSGRDDLKK